MTRAEPECGVSGQPVLLSAGLVVLGRLRAHHDRARTTPENR